MKYQTVKLWKIATVSAWNSAPQDEKLFKNWKYPFYRTADVWKVHYSRNLTEVKDYLNEEWIKWLKLYKKWTILFPKSWASTFLNHRVIMGQDWYVVSHLATISVNKDADENFVYYYLTTVDAKDLCADQWYPSLKSSNIAEVEIPLPPLETQKAIVAKLDQIFAELDQTKSEIQKNLDNTDELWKSALNQAFQGDWEMKTLQDVCLQKITDWTHQTPTYCGEKEWIPFISSKDVTKEYIDREWWIKYIPQSLHEELYARIAPQKDDVLLAKNWTTWVAAIVEDDRIFDIYVTLAVLRPNQQIITPRFLHRIVNSPICKRQFDKSLKWAGVPNLHLENIKTVTIPVPPLSEQEKIVEHLDQVSKEVKVLKSQYQSQLDNLEELKKSVLDKAFRWE